MRKIILKDKNLKIIGETNSININDFKSSSEFYNVPKIKYSKILQYMDYGVDILLPYNDGEDFIYQYTSAELRKFSGDISIDEIVGRRMSKLFPILVDLGLFNIIEEVYLNDSVVHLKLFIYDDGLLSYGIDQRILKDLGKIFIFSKNITNITLMEKREKLLFENADCGIIILNKENKIIRSNNKFFELSGYSIDELNNLGLFSIVDRFISYNDINDLKYDNLFMVDEVDIPVNNLVKGVKNNLNNVYENIKNDNLNFNGSIGDNEDNLNFNGSIGDNEDNLNFNGSIGDNEDNLNFNSSIKDNELENINLENIKNKEFIDKYKNKNNEEDILSLKESLNSLFEYKSLAQDFDLYISSKNKKKKWFKTHCSTIMYGGEVCVQFQCFEITKRKNAELAALSLQKNLRSIQKFSKLAIVEWNPITGFQWTNEIFDIVEADSNDFNNEEDIIFDLVLDEYKDKIIAETKKAILDNSYFDEIIAIKTKKGNLKYISVYGQFVVEDNNVIKQVGYVQDITKEFSEKEELKASLDDKEILLKEVHHRVKNNLQIILSLLNLELRFNPGAYEHAIEQTRTRINSLALIHEKIYQSVDISSVNIHEYIQSEIDALFSLYDINNINLDYDIDEVNINMDYAIPLGLIINELVHNVIKYAFPNDELGNLSVIFKKDGNNISLIIQDDGIGIPKNLDINNASSLGLTVVNSLVNQLEGSFTKLDNEGTALKIEFNIDD